MNSPRLAQIYGKYCKLEQGKKVEVISSMVQCTDIVPDVYEKGSRKNQTREQRGKEKAVRISVIKNTSVFNKTNKAMTNDENKSTVAELDLRLDL